MGKSWKCLNCKIEKEDITGWKIGDYQAFDENGEIVDDFMVFFCSTECRDAWELENIGANISDVEEGGERPL